LEQVVNGITVPNKENPTPRLNNLMKQFLGQLKRNPLAAIARAIPLALLISAIPSGARAFDTGHHFDLTRDAMLDRGFGNTAIEAVQVENWLTDYYSSSPTSKIKEVEKLHFDNLVTRQQVVNKWGHFTINTRNAVRQAAKEKDTLKLLTIMGISLHALQDFYTHSNWVDTHPSASPSTYQTQTFFSAPPSPETNLFTGVYPDSFPGKPPAGKPLHGDYKEGVNKDSYVRPNWDKAYVFAYAASREWIGAIQTWVNEVDPSFWETVKTFNVTGDDRAKLNRDLAAAYRISEWVNVAGQDGHWKGNGSGSAEFLPYAAAWTASPDGRFVAEFKTKKTYTLLTNGLTGDNAPADAVPAVPSLPLDHRAIIVRTLRVAEKDDVGTFESKIDTGGKADFYAKISVAGQTFIEAMQRDRASVNPSWMTIKFVPKSVDRVQINYQLWDEDGGASGKDDRVDINPKKGVSDLNFSFATTGHALAGDSNGVYDTEANPFNSAGAKPDKDRGIVQFFITERSLN
jgi:hypothetical protein